MNRKIIEYGLVTAPGDTELVTAVMQSIVRGYEPFGSLLVVPNQHGTMTIIQPIVKYEEFNDKRN